MRNLTLITMAQGNMKALKKTFDSFSGVVNEIVFGDLLLFEDDRKVLDEYCQQYNIKVVKFPFNYIFINGFSSLLNNLAAQSTNDLCIYMNCSEIVGKGKEGIVQTIQDNPDCNTFYFDHATDPHRWFRCYDRKQLKWSGVLHEEVVGEYAPYHKPLFQMADEEKDMDDPFKAKIFDLVKEKVYFNQYLKLVDDTANCGATNQGWIDFARDNYESMEFRLKKEKIIYEAFCEGDFDKFYHEIMTNKELSELNPKSSVLIEYQSDPKYLGK